MQNDVKGIGEQYDYTKENIQELWKCKNDFYHFIKYVKVITEDGESTITLREYQTNMIDIIKDNRYSILMSSRQSGKCVIYNTIIEIFDTYTKEIQKIRIGDFYNIINLEKSKSEYIYYLPLVTFCSYKISYFFNLVNKLLFKKFNSKKFTDAIYQDRYIVMTDTGWRKFKGIGKTIQYQIYHLICEDSFELKCADTHLVQTKNGFKCVQDLTSLDYVYTKTGFSKVHTVIQLDEYVEMYDLIHVDNHTYYTNNIVSHNTTTIRHLCTMICNI